MSGFVLAPWKLWLGRDKRYYRTLKGIFGIYPNNIELYKLALIHRSASLFLPDGKPINNERLEFLGDAILESVISDYLFIEYPEGNEGFLTQLRSRIVSRQTLNVLALQLGLDRYIVANNGGGNPAQKHIYGDAFEAMVGAIYLDKGYDFVNRLLINSIIPRYIDLEELTGTETDFKSRLLEWGQKVKKQVVFETAESSRSSHNNPNFMTVLMIGGEEEGRGEGRSKKEAEQAAAHRVLESLNGAVGREDKK